MRRLFLLTSIISALLLILPPLAVRYEDIGGYLHAERPMPAAAGSGMPSAAVSIPAIPTEPSVPRADEQTRSCAGSAEDTAQAAGMLQTVEAAASVTEPASSGTETAAAIPTPPKETERRDEACMLTVCGEDGQYTVSLADYLVGAVMAEMPASFHPEALRAQAIAARSYLLYRVNHGYRIYDYGSSCTAHFSEEEGRAFFGSYYEAVRDQMSAVVADTDGMVLYHDGDIICAAYHAMSMGSTENADEVWGGALPYLRAVTTPEDDGIAGMTTTAAFDEASLCRSLGVADALPLTVKRTDAGRLRSVTTACGTVIGGERFRSCLRLRSTAITVTSQTEDMLHLTVHGYGHGVGMSQYGADALGGMGYTCSEILAHYYPMSTLGLMP